MGKPPVWGWGVERDGPQVKPSPAPAGRHAPEGSEAEAERRPSVERERAGNTAGAQLEPTNDERLAPYVPRLLAGSIGRRAGWWQVDGTLVFADISGFTALAERLARQGRVGAEELVQVISAVFTELLSATDDGGDVLKFGGDALLLLYVGDDHPARAAHAAAGMRGALRRVGRISTPAGNVSLRMSVGLASGEIGCFLVGKDHLELLVLGSTVTATVEAESAADPGDVLLDPSTAAALPPAARGGGKGPGVLLAKAPALPPLGTAPGPVHPGVARFVPPPLRDRLGFGDGSEHRRTTVAFAHLGGIDELLATVGPEAVFVAADEVQRAVEEAAARYDACLVCTDVAADGAKWMLATGTPVAHEDDERRMLLTARHVLDACGHLRLRIGVNAGHVFGSDVGAPFRRTYSVMGDTTNLAARIMGKAEAGQLLAHADVVDRAAPGVEARPVEPFLVKGKSEPVRAAVVVGIDELSTEVASARTRFVGRADERRVLDDAARAAADGRGGLVEVSGDAGLGKTRLVTEAIGRHPVLEAVVARCEPYRIDRPYGVSRVLLRRLLSLDPLAGPDLTGLALGALVDERAPSLRPWLPLLAVAVGAEVAPTPQVDDLVEEFRDDRLRDAAAQLAVATASEHPTALVIEDAQWADAASRRLLTRLAREVPGRPWLVVVTRRPGGDGPVLPELPRPTEITLAPLDDRAAAELVRGTLAHAVPDRDVRAIVDRAAGNPLFLLELAAAAGSGGLPASVETTVAARIDALAPTDRETLRELAVLGSSFAEGDIAPVGHLDALGPERWPRLAPFLERDGSLIRFAHELFREVAYEGLTFGRRRVLHARVATALASAPEPERAAGLLALHWARAQRWEEAWRWARIAGEQARAADAPEDAVAALRQAVEAGARLRPRPKYELSQTWELLGDVCKVAGRLEEAGEAYRRALQIDDALSPDRRAEVATKLGIVGERTGRFRSALWWLGRVERLAGELTDPAEAGRLRARAAARTAGVRLRQGRLLDTVEAARRAVAVADAVGDRLARANAAFLLDAALTDLGRTDEAREWRHVALPIFEAEGDLLSQADVLNNLGANAFYEGRLDDALEYYGRDEALRERIGDTIGAAMASVNIAEVLADTDRLEEAVVRFTDARSTFAGSGHRVGAAFAASHLGRCLTRLDRVTEAVPLLDDALAEFRQLGADGLVTETLVRRAEVLLAAGRHVDAGRDATDALARIPGSTNPALADAARAVLAQVTEVDQTRSGGSR